MFNCFYTIAKTPIIILGNQKSGTTAIATLLAKRVNLEATIDTDVLWEPNLSKLLNQKKSLQDVVAKNKKTFSKKIIKEPNLTFFFSELKQIFVNPIFVFIIRDPRGNIRSILNRLGLNGDLDWFNDFKSLPLNWRHLFSNHFSSRMHYIEILADRWNLCANTYLDNKDDMILIRYEDFLSNKLHHIDTLTENLNMQPINNIDEILDKQFQPRGNIDISWQDFFGDKNCSKIETICETNMKMLGYNI